MLSLVVLGCLGDTDRTYWTAYDVKGLNLLAKQRKRCHIRLHDRPDRVSFFPLADQLRRPPFQKHEKRELMVLGSFRGKGNVIQVDNSTYLGKY